MKVKPASHVFRVSTDPVRLGYRDARAIGLADVLQPRRDAAMAIAWEAAATIPRDDGYRVRASGTGPDVAAVVADAHDVVRRVDLERARETANKPFMVKLVDMDGLTLGSPLIQFGLRREIIASAAAYLGIVPILQYVNVLYSSHAANEPAKSQLYHCDSDEAEQVKVFIVCEEVTPATGPLTFISAASSKTVRDRVGYKYNRRLTDDEVRAALGAEFSEVALTGAAGTTAFIDTSRCFHYGSRFTDYTARRIVVMLQYVTPLAFILPDDFLEGARFRHLAAPGHDDITSMVLGSL